MKKDNLKDPNLQLEIRRVRKVDLDRVGGGACGNEETNCPNYDSGRPRTWCMGFSGA